MTPALLGAQKKPKTNFFSRDLFGVTLDRPVGDLKGIRSLLKKNQEEPIVTRRSFVKRIDRYFCSLGTATLALWECISGGMDWQDRDPGRDPGRDVKKG